MPARRSLLVLRHPAQYVVVAFTVAALAGSALLSLPLATEAPDRAPYVTALFTSVSAVCVTGLNVVDPASHWSLFGELVLMALIQVGGFGIMTLSSLVVVVLARRLGLRQRILAAAETRALDMGDLRNLLVGVARFSLAVEAVAAVLLLLRFWLTHHEPIGRAAYLGAFHAVSSFNNAGFALFGDNLVGFNDDPVILLVVAVAIITGGLGYPVWVQVARSPRRPSRWSLHAKLTVSTTLGLLAVGTVGFAFFEWTNHRTIGGLSGGNSVVNAFFQAVTPRTAGFNAVDIGSLRETSRLLTEALMFIGGGSASTAGGIKVTTFAVLGWVMWAEARGDPDVVAFRRRIPTAIQRQALSVALLAIGVVIGATMLLTAMTSHAREDVQFEVISALGTVGLTADLTPLLDAGSQLVVAALMLVGRVGPITLFAALVLRERELLYRHPEERPIVG